MSHVHWILDTSVYKHNLRFTILSAFLLQQSLYESASVLPYTYRLTSIEYRALRVSE